MHKQLFFAPLLLLGMMAFAQTRLSFDDPPATPALLGKEFISTGLYERDWALSPDRNEIFYTLQSGQNMFQTILYIKKDSAGNWGAPAVAPFAGRFSDLEPAFSPNGKQLFFSSNRPVSGSTPGDFNIWVVEKKEGRWGEPVIIGETVNTTANEFYPSVAANGNLYFTAAYPHGTGREDIWMSPLVNGQYSTPVLLDTAINSKNFEFNAFVAPDESFIIFTVFGRTDDKGRGDLYMSLKDAQGKWKPARCLSILNSDRLDYCPFVSYDKRILFFTSDRNALQKVFAREPATFPALQRSFSGPQNGNGDIYWVSFAKVLESVR
jgi:Tol biopolymer transport system component